MPTIALMVTKDSAIGRTVVNARTPRQKFSARQYFMSAANGGNRAQLQVRSI
jgi:hypothetical protein